jgi:hypothetical protein
MALHRIELPGLDASNLLGYMAALGTLRVLTLADPAAGVRMNWTEDPDFWMPVLWHSKIDTAEDLVAAVAEACGREVNLAWTIAPDLTIPPKEFAEQAGVAVREARASASGQVTCQFLAAFGSDGCTAGNKGELIADTEFRTMSGAGHQHFLGFMCELHACTGPEHLASALLKPWEYVDDKPSMRWDPNDYRPHALRATDPASDPIRTVRGANRLAIEALPLFPAMPTLKGLRTTGFVAGAITYPVWIDPLDCASAASLIALADLQFEGSDRRQLNARGIGQVFRAERFTEGKYRNFSPSRALL